MASDVSVGLPWTDEILCWRNSHLWVSICKYTMNCNLFLLYLQPDQHHSKPNVVPVEVLPVYPDFDVSFRLVCPGGQV